PSHPPFPQEDPSGTFVQLRLSLAQTACRKRAPQRHCRVLESRCPPRVPTRCQPLLCPQEIRQRDEAECRAVEEAGKGGDTLYLPGMFAFSRGLPA
ncbi:RARR2 protein, partial [Pachycephala philippinensis]|nr:RARR2 protein [Pachycephala philippinensis]